MTLRIKTTTIGALLLVSACATQPKNLSTTPVSPTMYNHLDCNQLALEGAQIAKRETILFNSLKKTADRDTIQMGIGLVLFWPALFLLEGGDGTQAAEYSLLKGQHRALEEAAILRKCPSSTIPPLKIHQPPEEDEME